MRLEIRLPPPPPDFRDKRAGRSPPLEDFYRARTCSGHTRTPKHRRLGANSGPGRSLGVCKARHLVSNLARLEPDAFGEKYPLICTLVRGRRTRQRGYRWSVLRQRRE